MEAVPEIFKSPLVNLLLSTSEHLKNTILITIHSADGRFQRYMCDIQTTFFIFEALQIHVNLLLTVLVLIIALF